SDTTMARKARTDYAFRWATPAPPIRWRNDSAYARVVATVAGDKVTRVTPSLRFPDAYRDRSQTDMAGMFVVIFFVGAVASIVVAGESLAYKHEPTVSAGLGDLMRGRVLIPEVVTSVSRGYALGGILALLTAALVFVSQVAGVGSPVFPPFSFGDFPFGDAMT